MSELGSDPASVLRIISHFDELDESAANADAVVRSAALLAECPVGARWPSGTVIRYDATGRLDIADDARWPAPPEVEPAVWLERQGGAQPLDPVVVDRVRRSLRVATPRAPVSPRIGDPALLEVVLSGTEHREDRARAIRLLGLHETRPTRVLAVSSHSPPEALKIIAHELPGPPVHSAAIGGATAVVFQGASDTRALSDGLDRAIVDAFPAPMRTGADRGPWVGIGASVGVFAASTSWRQALRALRFASSTGYGRRAIAYERLSSLELLTELPPERVNRNSEVMRINELAATTSGAQAVSAVEAFCVFGSLRRAAAELHVHHSTVAARLAQVASVMGWDFDDPMDRFMATLVLMVRRVALSSAELDEHDLP